MIIEGSRDHGINPRIRGNARFYTFVFICLFVAECGRGEEGWRRERVGCWIVSEYMFCIVALNIRCQFVTEEATAAQKIYSVISNVVSLSAAH